MIQYATLTNNTLITTGYNADLITEGVTSPGRYKVRTCKVRGQIVEFGSGIVNVQQCDLDRAERIGATGAGDTPALSQTPPRSYPAPWWRFCVLT